MTDFDPATFSSYGPREFARAVKATPDARIAEVMTGELREPILREVFDRMPAQFRADRAGGTEAVIHWTVTGRPDGGADTYEVVVADGACAVSDTPTREPRLALTMGPVEFLKLVAGAGNPVLMFMTGKLKARGDLALAATVATLFDIPRA
jgi:putative sterol carrier protein